MRSLARLVAGFIVATLLVGAGWWAANTALEPPADPLLEAQPVTYTVVEGEVGRTLQFAAVAEWELTPVGVNSAAGVITSVEVGPATEVSSGDVLYTVDLRPVVVAEGSVPSFRALASKAKGEDVEQLQTLLTKLGHYSGDLDGVFGTGLRTAVKAWQKSLGITADGVVQQGDIVFVAELPAPIALSESIRVGARLSGGEELVLSVPTEPTFRIPLSVEQRNLVPLSASVEVVFAEGIWDSQITSAQESEFDQLNLILAGTQSASPCGTACTQWVSLTEPTDFLARIVVEPTVIGPIVPTAALGSAPDGSVFITFSDGTTKTVEILGSSDGLAVVSGVEVGELLLLPFTRTEG